MHEAVKKRYQALLAELIAFRSISTDPHHHDELTACAAWLKEQFEARGFQVEVVEGYGNPIVTARLSVADDAETCLIYGHYDVQPAHQSEGWHGEPFSVVEQDGRLFARGVVDNKGQVFVHVATLFELIERGELGYNVVFMIEGDEETGSARLEDFIRDHKDRLAADFALISDGEITAGMPTLELGFRGGFNATITVRTSHTDLHSGLFGGAVPNAGRALNRFIASLHDEENRVTLPGFYDDVDPIGAREQGAHEKLPFDEEEHKLRTGTSALETEPGYDFYTQTGLRPALEITSMEAGYQGEGYRNAIPSWARAKLNFRLVKSQDPQQIAATFREHAREQMPDSADVEIETTPPYQGIKLNVDNGYIGRAATIMRDVYGTEPLLKYCGGGLPIVTYFHELLGLPQVLAPLANEDCNMHAVNENFELAQLHKSLHFSEHFFKK